MDFWLREAQRHVLVRRIETFNTALLPHQKPSVIRGEKDALIAEIARFEFIESATEIRTLERDSRQAMDEFERRKAVKRQAAGKRRRRAKKSAGRQF